MKVFIDYDHDNDCYVASSEDGKLTASNQSDMFVKLSFVKAAKAAGHSGHAGDYDFILRSSRLAQERDRPINLDEFWGGVNQKRIERRDKILELAKQGVEFKKIAAQFDVPIKYIEQVVRDNSSS